MIILGICDSHEAHACLVKDGELLAAIAEERLSRLKADMGYPRLAIERVLSISGISPCDIDLVAVAGKSGNLFKAVYKHTALFEVKHWIEQCYKIWKPVLLEGKKFSHFEDFELWEELRSDIDDDPYYDLIDLLRKTPQDKWMEVGQKYRRNVIHKHLGISFEQIKFYRHEDCHKYYGYYSAQKRPRKALVLTVEGGGDDSSATISVIDNGNIEEYWRSNEVSLGRLYRYVTLILGMKPTQHEYKVMGLAPYGTEYHGHRSLEFFRTINKVSGTKIININKLPDLYFSVKDALEGERFDGIAWGIQAYLEEILLEWIRNIVEEYGIQDVILSGGVAQNIKVCKAISEMPEVNSFWAGPISGDGSLGIGASWLASYEFDIKNEIRGLDSVYLGSPSGKTEDILKIIEHNKLNKKYKVIENTTLDQVAIWLDNGLIIARFSGRMEFGQRALGNRSILADPRRIESVERINQKIKYRDFWMPFTPSMLIEEADRLLENPKGIYSPFMTMAFNLKNEFVGLIPAVVHPSDKTVRPQMLQREDNPQYYDLINAFKKRTGLGVLLNTSFNLHGDAIVESPQDAIDTFLKSDLDILLFDNIAISRVDSV